MTCSFNTSRHQRPRCFHLNGSNLHVIMILDAIDENLGRQSRSKTECTYENI